MLALGVGVYEGHKTYYHDSRHHIDNQRSKINDRREEILRDIDFIEGSSSIADVENSWIFEVVCC